MAKKSAEHGKSKGATTSTEEWIEAMKKKTPESVQNFLNMLDEWGYATAGHAFGRIKESFANCIEFYLHKYDQSVTDAEARNIELLKERLERAFANSEAFGKDLEYDAYKIAA